MSDLISREALKKAINDNGCRHLFYFDVFDVIDDAPAVEDKSTDEWVPISERLPIRNGVYNVTRKLKEGETIYFISDVSYFDGQNTWHSDICVNHGRPYLNDITAWQELPEPYKEGGTE